MTEQALSTRLINSLAAGSQAGTFEFLGGSSSRVRVGDRLRSGTTTQMWAWLDGFQRGGRLPGEGGWWASGGAEKAAERLAAARADVAEYRQVLVDPSLADQLRVQVLAAMETAGLNFAQLAERIDVTPQSVRDALSFANPHPRIGSIGLFDEMIRGCGHRFTVGREVALASDDVVEALVADRSAESPGIARLRMLLIAVERRLIDGVDPVGVNRARRSRSFRVSVAGAEVERARDTLTHWLAGLADGSGDEIGQSAITPE